jgi:hypothetical protein
MKKETMDNNCCWNCKNAIINDDGIGLYCILHMREVKENETCNDCQ